jgi:hypothetical protein
MGRNTQLSIEDDSGTQVAVYKYLMDQSYFFKMEIKLVRMQKSVSGIHTQLL